jgi:hypothetical protein
MRAACVLLLSLLLGACQHGAWLSGAEVDFVNASKPTRCAEEDNVYVRVAGEDIGRFRIRAEHPPYIAEIREDSTAPDFTHCDMSADPSFAFTARKVVLYEDASIRLVGHTFGTFWRPTVVNTRVGDRNEPGLHLIQLIRRSATSEVEQLVVYPADGYWRVKPMPPRTLPDTAYGSSFLFGPVEEDGRPFVAIREIVFEPEPVRFRLEFADGRRGVLQVVQTRPDVSILEMTVEPPVPAGQPFAALRSMYVTERQADVAVASRPGKAQGAVVASPVLEFDRFRSRSARFGRVVPSHHNLSAPDFVFEGFERSTARQGASR